MAYDSRAPIHFQKSAWAGTTVMIKLAEEFAQHAKGRHNGLGCVLFCDNLSVHVADEAKEIFHKGNVFLCFCPPQSTQHVRPAGAGRSRSLRFSTACLLER